MRRAFAAAIFVLALTGSAQAAPMNFTQSSGIVSATFSYDQTADSYGNPVFANERLRISRSGQVFYDQPVTSGQCSPQCDVDMYTSAAGPLTLADVEHVGQPDVIVNLYTGGAHCCFVEQVYAYDPGTMTYTRTERNFGDPGATISDL